MIDQKKPQTTTACLKCHSCNSPTIIRKVASSLLEWCPRCQAYQFPAQHGHSVQAEDFSACSIDK